MTEEVRCAFCNRKLRNPVHRAARVGPACARKHGLAYAHAPRRLGRVRRLPSLASPSDVPLFPESL